MLKTGKLPENMLSRSVFKLIKHRRDDVLLRPEIGNDCALADLGEGQLLAVSSDPVIGTGFKNGTIAVNEVVNDLICSGATPVGVMVTALLPNRLKERHIKQYMQEIDDECARFGMEVMGGHTQVTPAVNEIVLSVTGIGKVSKQDLLVKDNVKAGYEIVMTKTAGLKGTFIIANQKEEELLNRYPSTIIENAKKYIDSISIAKEGTIALENGAAYMHDISEGGVYGALWEMASILNLGLEVDLKKIPIKQETVEVCDYVDVNPYKIPSSGALLIATEHGNAMVDVLRSNDIEAAVIGRFTDNNDKVIVNESEKKFLEHPVDEISKIFQ